MINPYQVAILLLFVGSCFAAAYRMGFDAAMYVQQPAPDVRVCEEVDRG